MREQVWVPGGWCCGGRGTAGVEKDEEEVNDANGHTCNKTCDLVAAAIEAEAGKEGK